jgi:F0F1-type ATP synthase membrane subunit b/b'
MNETMSTEILASGATFILLWIVLGHLIFKPFFELLEEREARTTGDEHLAQEKKNRARVLEQQIEEKLREARLSGIAGRDERVKLAKGRAQEIVDLAVKQASEELERAETQIQALKTRALEDLAAESERLSGLVISRTLASDSSQTIH